MDTKKIIRITYYVVVIVMVTISLYGIYAGNNQEVEKGANFGVWQGLVYAGIATAAALILAILGLAMKPKGAIAAAAGVIGLGLLYFIGKSMAAGTVPLKLADEGIGLGTLQNSEAGVWIAAVLIGLSVLMAIASGVKSLFD